MPEPEHALMATNVTYYSRLDEVAFFSWLDRINCIGHYEGRCSDLTITLTRLPDDDELREFIALFHGYGVEMRQLAKFDFGKQRTWFRQPEAFLHAAVFG